MQTAPTTSPKTDFSADNVEGAPLGATKEEARQRGPSMPKLEVRAVVNERDNYVLDGDDGYTALEMIRLDLWHADYVKRACNAFGPMRKALEAVSAQLRKRECSTADCKALDQSDAALKLAGEA